MVNPYQFIYGIMGGRSEFSDAAEPGDVLETLANHELPESTLSLIDAYDDTLGDRDPTFWRWLHNLFPAFTLSSVDSSYADDVQTAKLIASIFVTVLDDIAEKHDDRLTFEEAAKVPFDHQHPDLGRDGVDEQVVGYVDDLWVHFRQVEKGPREGDYCELLMFDIRQVICAIEYSYLANNNLNVLGTYDLWEHEVHNMAVHIYADLDLMASPTFDLAELSRLRAVVTHAERIARICNWITTWERELHEGDCSSGVVAYALNEGIVSVDELEAIRRDPREEDVHRLIREIHDQEVESIFEHRLEEEFESAKKWGQEITTVDIDSYLEGFQHVQKYHAASKDLL